MKLHLHFPHIHVPVPRIAQPEPSRTRFVFWMVLIALVAFVGVCVSSNNYIIFVACAACLLMADAASFVAIRTRRGQLASAVVVSAWIMIDLGICVAVWLAWVLAKQIVHF